ncbi:MAG: phosphohistidine phosphatase SixA [bacterium]|nr:MAG: phosphohistidine phosphatase SixA [bacterium]
MTREQEVGIGMMVYLVRHGEALAETRDPSRPLSGPGREEVLRTGRLLARRMRMLPGFVHHSPKTRAAQTAELLGQCIPGLPSPVPADGLLPMDDPGLWAQRLETADRDIMLVGHLPHLSRLASLLLLWDAGREILEFTPGTIVCLEKTGNWKVRWMISPPLVKPDSEGP